MDLTIMKPSLTTIQVHCDLYSTVEDLKNELESRTGIPLDGQTLMYGSTELEDDFRLKDYNMHREHKPVIRLIWRQEEPTTAPTPWGRRWL